MPDEHDDAGEPAGTAGSASASGPDLVREALDRARASMAERRGRASAGGNTAGIPARRPTVRRSAGDPVALSGALESLVSGRGWQANMRVGELFGRWADIVGPEVAARAQPVTLEDGQLTVQAESTAWATQLRMMSRELLAAITNRLGANVVTGLTIRGPASARWSTAPGRRRVRGRGPRDTFG